MNNTALSGLDWWFAKVPEINHGVGHELHRVVMNAVVLKSQE